MSLPSKVCRKAAAAAAAAVDPSRISPWLMLRPSSDGSANNMYSLASNKVLSFKREPASPLPPAGKGPVKVVGSSHGWVATFNDDNCDVHLSDPISGRHMKLPHVPEPFRSPRCRSQVERLILTDTPTVDNCLALMEYGKRNLAVCRPGRDGAWSTLGDGFYRDMVYSARQKRLFTVRSDKELVEVWNLSNPTSPRREWATNVDIYSYECLLEEGPTKSDEEEDERFSMADDRRGESYLVYAEDSTQLFLLERCIEGYPYRTVAFDVYEVYWKERSLRGRKARRYVRDGSLNGLAMFVGINHGFALRASEFPEVKADSIYFTDEWDEDCCFDENRVSYGGHDIGVYNYVERSVSSVYYPCPPSPVIKINPPPFWFTPTS